MPNDSLRELLVHGYDEHASTMGSGTSFESRYFAGVSRRVTRRRAARAVAIAGGTVASVTVLAIGANAVAHLPFAQAPAVSPSPTGSNAGPVPGPSPDVSPSPAPTAAPLDLWRSQGTVIPPLPTGPAAGVVNEDAILRLVTGAAAPSSSPTAPAGIGCGAPIAGTYVDPLFDEASARILRPDTPYPTFLDPSYSGQPGDVFLGLRDLLATGGLESPVPAGTFWVALSYRSEALAAATVYDPDTGLYSGGVQADYDIVANGGDIAGSGTFTDLPGYLDLAFGAVLVRDGVVIGHAELGSQDGSMPLDITLNEVSATTGTVDAVRDFGLGRLESVTWCGAAPAGGVDAYAVVGSTWNPAGPLAYSVIWAGQVEYK